MTDWADLSLFVGAVTASVASLILAIQRSKCTAIDCGCIHCKRAVEMTPLDHDPPSPPDLRPPAVRNAPVRVQDLEASLNPPMDPSEIV